MGGNGHYEEFKEPIENLAREITQNYVRELTKEATKKAVISKTKSLDEKGIIELENEIREKSDKENINSFKEVANKIFKDIHEGSIKGDKVIDQISNILEDSPGIRDYERYKELKEPVKSLASEITHTYVRELTKEATKKAIQTKVGDLTRKQIIELENEIKKKTDEEQVDQFKESTDKILKGIHEGSIKGNEEIEQISNTLKSSLDTGISLSPRKSLYPKNIRFVTPIMVIISAIIVLIILSISVSPEDLNFELGENESGYNSFHILNSEKDVLKWRAYSDEQWISLSPEGDANSDIFDVKINTTGLKPGPYVGNITVKSRIKTEHCTVHLLVKNKTEIQPTSPPTSFEVSPSFLSFSLGEGKSAFGQLQILNGGGGTLQWNVSSDPDKKWINLKPTSGINSSPVTFTVNASGLKPYTYEGKITIESNAGTKYCPIKLEVTNSLKPPLLAVYPSSLNFNLSEGESTSGQLQISNGGGGTLQWNVSSDPDKKWIDLQPTNGTNSGTITFTINAESLKPDTYQGNITIESDTETKYCPIKLKVTNGPSLPLLVVYPYFLSFNLNEGEFTSKQLQILNGGGGTLQWNVSSDSNQTWIDLSPTNGVNSGIVSVTANTENLEPGVHEGNISIESNAGTCQRRVVLTIARSDETDEGNGDGESEPDRVLENPTLSVDPLSLNFDLSKGEPKSQDLSISNKGGGTLQWNVSLDPDGRLISVYPLRGINSSNVTVTANNTENLGPGNYLRDFTVVSNGGNEKVTIKIIVPEILQSPLLRVEPPFLNFNLIQGELRSQNLNILNIGGGALQWNVSLDPYQPWISMSPSAGINSSKVNVTVNSIGLDPHQYKGNITAMSNGGNKTVPINVTVLPPTPILDVMPPSLDFNLSQGESISKNVSISNIGGGLLQWNVSSYLSWISIDPLNGTDSSNVNVTVNITGLELGEYAENITIISNGGNKTVPINVTVLPPKPRLKVEPTFLNLTLDEEGFASEQFQISNEGEGTLQWNITLDPDEELISLNRTSGTNLSDVTVTASNTEELEPGTYTRNFTVVSNGGNQTVTVNVTVAPLKPRLHVEPLSLDFNLTQGESVSQNLNISNVGGGTLQWNVSSSKPWISVDPFYGTNNATNSSNVTVTVNTTNLSMSNMGETPQWNVNAYQPRMYFPYAQQYNENITVTSNGDNITVPINITVLEASPKLNVTPPTLDFNLTQGELRSQNLSISNIGGGTLQWDLSSSKPWISMDPWNGTNSSNVNVTVNTTSLGSGQYNESINVTSNGDNITVPMNVTVLEAPPVLKINPLSLDFNLSQGESVSQNLNISNTGGGTLQWNVSSPQSWINVDPVNGANNETNSSNVTVTVNTTNLSMSNMGETPQWNVNAYQQMMVFNPYPQQYTGNINVTSNGGSKTVTVNVTITEPSPMLSVEPSFLNLTLDEERFAFGQFQILNLGGGTLQWNITLDPDERLIRLNSTSGTNLGDINVTAINTEELEPGTYPRNLTVMSNGGNQTVTVNVTVAPLKPRLHVEPLSLDFNLIQGESVSQNLNISNVGGGTLQWNVSSPQSWISVDPVNGANNETNSSNVTVTVNTTNLSIYIGSTPQWKASSYQRMLNSQRYPQNYTENITVMSNGGDETVTVNVTITEPSPILNVEPLSLDFNLIQGESVSQNLSISNVGRGTLQWNVSSSKPWISMDLMNETNNGTNSSNVNVTVNATALAPVQYNESINVTSNGDNITVPINVTVLEASPMLKIDPLSLDFNLSQGETGFQNLNISNAGGGMLEWNVSSPQSWINVDPVNGANNETNSSNVTVTVNTTNLSMSNMGETPQWNVNAYQQMTMFNPYSQQYTGNVNVTSNGGNKTVTVNVTALEAPPILRVEPTFLNLTLDEEGFASGQFRILNLGGGALEWNVSLDPDERLISLNRTSGTNLSDVTVTASNTEELEPGTYTRNFTIMSYGGDQEVTIYVNVQAPPPTLSIDPSSLDFNLTQGQSDSRMLSVLKTGEGSIQWSVTTSQPWISSDPSSGMDSGNISVTVNTTDLISGEYNERITVTAEGKSIDVPVKVNVQAPPPTLKGPDLVVTSLEIMGNPKPHHEYYAALPIRVVVRNQGDMAADIFKISIEYYEANISSSVYTAPFRAPKESSSTYPFTGGLLDPKKEVTFEGDVLFNNPGEKHFIAIADICNEDDLVNTTYCRVNESNEKNNKSPEEEILIPEWPN